MLEISMPVYNIWKVNKINNYYRNELFLIIILMKVLNDTLSVETQPECLRCDLIATIIKMGDIYRAFSSQKGFIIAY